MQSNRINHEEVAIAEEVFRREKISNKYETEVIIKAIKCSPALVTKLRKNFQANGRVILKHLEVNSLKSAQLKAQELYEKFFEFTPCVKCGCTRRYTSTASCTSCVKISRETNRGEPTKKKSKTDETLTPIKNSDTIMHLTGRYL